MSFSAGFAPFVPDESQTNRLAIGYPWGDHNVFLNAHSQAAPASVAWPLANLGIFLPVYINERCIAYSVGYATGTGTGGNGDIGIYDLSGNRLKSSGAIARSASAWVNNDWTDYTIEPGYYYVGMSCDGTTNMSGVIPAAGICQAMGIVEATSAYVLPSSLTFAATTRAFIPNFAINLRSVLV